MEVRPIRPEELEEVAALIAAQQARDARHIAYESTEPAAIAEELAELEPAGLDAMVVAVDGDRVVGALAAEWDDRPPRVWWHGPYVDGERWAPVADALLEAGRALVPDELTQEELAPDDRHVELASWARDRGFVPEEASVVLGRDLGEPPSEPTVPDVEVRAFAEADRPAVAALHEELFPGTHLAGDRLDSGRERVILVAQGGERVLGYAAAERQSDGTGYLDYLGVDAEARGRGVGAALVGRVCTVLAAERGCPSVDLTVREGNEAARRLYASLGFREERLIRPWRRGFSLA